MQCRSLPGSSCAAQNAISINLLEIVAMVMTAYVMVYVSNDNLKYSGRTWDDEGRQYASNKTLGGYVRGNTRCTSEQRFH